ncbi:MAG TPA: hypothetical protein PKA59_06330 [Chakrabartia sp.]|nr:hypothetical protein [Chakrabartia sp.]
MNDDEQKMKRLDMLHRLGVFVIFDSDLDGDEVFIPPLPDSREVALSPYSYASVIEEASKAETNSKKRELLNLRHFFPTLIETTKQVGNREEHIGQHWRSMKSRVSLEKKIISDIWPVDLNGLTAPDGIKERINPAIEALNEIQPTHDFICVIGPSGIGKGTIAREFASQFNGGIRKENRLCVNGGFSFDTDSLLDGIAWFLSHRRQGCQSPYTANGQFKLSRSEFLAKPEILNLLPNGELSQPDTLIIINGMERFFSIKGQPISAEFEEMLRLAAHHATTLTKDGSTRSSGRSRVKWVFFGTERIKAFMRDELNAKIVDLTRIYGVWPAEAKRPNTMLDCVEHWIKPHLGSDTLDMVTPARWREYEEARKGYLSQSSSRISGDIQSVRRAFYSMVLSGPVLGKLFEKNGKLALTLLRNLAFIGFPTEASVLAHCPAVRARSSFSGQDKAKAPPTLAALRQTLELLCQYGLVMKIPGFKDYVSTGADPEPRYALHRSLLGEMRYRFGIPLSEAKLSTAFNMSLYVAQPVDGSIPEPEIHDELGNLVDRLIGSYRDPSGIQYDTVQVLSGQLSSVGKVVDPVKLRGAIEAAKHACRACDDDTCNEEESLLRIHRLCSPEHIQCLRAALSIIRCYYSIASILTLDSGDRLVSADRDGILLEHAERLDRLIDAYGKISLARETLRVSSIKDDFDRIFGAAEPFYADELVWLHNERGVVRLTMGDLYEARVSFERALSVNRQYVEGEDRAHNWRRIRMNQITVDLEMGDLGLAERKIAEIEEATQIVRQRRHGSELREDRLSLAIAKGYQGWCKHLRGQKGMARKLYTSALNEFAELGEARAQAYFARLAANVPEPAQDTRTRLKEIRAALGFAQSTRQMDVVYRILIVLADEYIFGPDATENSRKEANRILDDAIRYSLQTDTHRVRFEAAQIIARFRLKNGDYEGAFRHAADALTVATRNGMELRKITARALIAGIMSARGHPITAEHLVRTAIKAASRIGFETAIELAENASRQIPHISPSTGGFEPLGQ